MFNYFNHLLREIYIAETFTLFFNNFRVIDGLIESRHSRHRKYLRRDAKNVTCLMKRDANLSFGTE